MTKPFGMLTGPAAALLRDNINTDVIIRIERLTNVGRGQLGPYALEAIRFRPDGAEEPAFVLNQPAFRYAPILLCGANFGCGSSREGAVWALMERGVSCVIAPSFGGIFLANCFQNGLLPVTLPASVIAGLAFRAATGEPVTVDLAEGRITAASGPAIAFTLDPRRRELLLSGLDEITLTLRDTDAIIGWQCRDRAARPWIWETLAMEPTA